MWRIVGRSTRRVACLSASEKNLRIAFKEVSRRAAQYCAAVEIIRTRLGLAQVAFQVLVRPLQTRAMAASTTVRTRLTAPVHSSGSAIPRADQLPVEQCWLAVVRKSAHRGASLE